MMKCTSMSPIIYSHFHTSIPNRTKQLLQTLLRIPWHHSLQTTDANDLSSITVHTRMRIGTRRWFFFGWGHPWLISISVHDARFSCVNCAHLSLLHSYLLHFSACPRNRWWRQNVPRMKLVFFSMPKKAWTYSPNDTKSISQNTIFIAKQPFSHSYVTE